MTGNAKQLLAILDEEIAVAKEVGQDELLKALVMVRDYIADVRIEG